MPLKKDNSGRRWVEMEFLVPGTPEQVWQAIATGPGMSAWFTSVTVDEREGGAITFDFGDANCGQDVSTGKVTVWNPPERFAYEEYNWSGDAPPVGTEVTVTGRSGDSCVVRMVHSLFTERDDWDDELESFETGWPGFFEVLRVYLRHFAGRPSAAVHAMSGAPGGDAEIWAKLTSGLNLAGANVGDRCQSPSGAPRLAGTVERIHQTAIMREIMLRLDEPHEGVAVIGSCDMGGEARGMASIFFYGPQASDTAAAEQKKWTDWMRGVLEGDTVAP
ncbi:SRPBCC family protein [Mycobacterium deserti]|uniref:SRPBCC domain-containing protein n=1 Tax=Mycobacterium deserti TaxID=2978347 RepID=A0ABT2M922_9MYCO|nr:SRPBCC domain-containing protein [Mycobacterium deserti]MCT7658761.1 SRPBCC domain-containing protein [Mycobacterium deserti]